MPAPMTSVAGKIYVEEGPEALLRFVGECGGVERAAKHTSTNRSAWQRFLVRSRRETELDWRDFAKPRE